MDEAYLWRGVHSIARNQFKGATVSVTHTQSGTKYTLEVRVFNDGMGLRDACAQARENAGWRGRIPLSRFRRGAASVSDEHEEL